MGRGARRVWFWTVLAAISLVLTMVSPAVARAAGGSRAGTRAARSAPIGGAGGAKPVSARSTTGPEGYRAVGTDGGVFDYGTNRFLGSLPGLHVHPAAPISSMEPTPDGLGYWLVGRDGGIFTFGDAGFHGSLGGVRLARPIVAMAGSHSGAGYWLVGSDGGVFAFGDARFYGSLGGIHLKSAIVGMASTPDSKGYWLVGSDGGVFAFGDARFYGSLGGTHLAAPIVGIASAFTGSGSSGDIPGYWLLGSDGGVFAFGAPYHGSLPAAGIATARAIGITATVDNGGYWIGTADGTVAQFGDAPNLGDFHSQEAARGTPGAVLADPWLELTTVAPPGSSGYPPGGGSGPTPPGGPPTTVAPPAPTLMLSYASGTTSQMPTGSNAAFDVVVDLSGAPDGGAEVTFTVTGPNARTQTVQADGSGTATFSYTGSSGGSDTVVASASNGSSPGSSNSLTVTWSAPVALADTGQVTGQFFAEPAGSTSFVARPGDPAAFGQSFPDLAFNPPAGLLAIPPGAPEPSTVPFTDVVTDAGGSYAGVMPAEGSGYRAGAVTDAGDLTNFDAVFTGSLSAGQSGYLTLGVISGDGFVLGVGGGVSAFSGQNTGGPDQTPFDGYQVVAADDSCLVQTANGNAPTPGDYPVTIKLPSAGSFPYELDYFSCNTASAGVPLRSLVLRVQGLSSTPPSAPTVYLGYDDTSRQANNLFHYFPFPWVGSPGVDFQGCAPSSSCDYDSGAVRVDNTTSAPMTIDKVVVNMTAPAAGYFDSTPTPYSCVYDIWAPDAPTGTPEAAQPAVVLQPGQTAIYTQEVGSEGSGCNNTDGEFDTSDVPYSCQQSGIIPQVSLTIDGTTSTYADTNQILNTGGVDKANCATAPLNNESSPWTRIAGPGTGSDVPLPPQAGLTLQPTQAEGGGALTQTVDDTQVFTATASAASGTDLAGVPVTFIVTGTNPRRVTVDTDAGGVATLSYSSGTAGTDEVSAIGSYQGLTLASGVVGLDWQIPTPGQTTGTGGSAGQDPPAVAVTSPPAGATLTTPTAVTATISAPAGQTITTWTATLEGSSHSSPVTLATGSGPPPSTLATVDPTHLAPGAYQVTVTATAGGGGYNSASTSFEVGRVAKVGNFSVTYRDASLSVDGIPVTVDRTYDSFDRSIGDFGYGWTLSLSQAAVATNGALGAGGWAPEPDACSLFGCTYAYKSSVAHTASVTLPGGQQEVFDFAPTGGFGPLFFLGGAGGFAPRPGTQTTGTLAVFDDPGVYYGFDGNLYSTASAGTSLYAPTDFVYTDTAGTQYLISTQYGLLAERQASGTCLAYSPAGVYPTNYSTGLQDNGSGDGGCAGNTGYGNPVNVARDGQDRVTSIALPDGATYSYSYTTGGDLAAVTLPGTTGTDAYTYDSDHDLLSESGPGAPELTQTYDAAGDLTAVTDASGDTVTVASNPADRTQTLTDPLGDRTTVETYDPAGDLASKSVTSGGQTRTTTYTYDAAGDMTSQTDPLGRTTTYTYDASGNRTSTTDPLGHTSDAVFNGQNLQTSVSDALGRTTTSSYDPSGDLLGVEAPSGVGVSITYNSQDQPDALTDAAGDTYTLAYDGSGAVSVVTDPLGQTFQLTHADGYLTNVTDPLGNQTHYGYDAQSRPTSVTNPDNDTSSQTYNAAGEVATTTDANGNVTTYTYDTAGLLTGIGDAAGGEVSLTYDRDGNLTSLTDPDGHMSSYTYDGFGERTTSTDPSGNVTHYGYDADGEIVSIGDAEGGTTTYSYDADGDVAGRTDAGGTTSWSYDAAGELVSETDPTGTTTYTYDAAGEVTEVTAPAGTIAYTYDSSGRRSSMTLPGNRTVAYGYDADGNLVTESGLGQTVTLGYDKANRLTTLTYPNGDVTTYSYDRASLISAVTTVDVHGDTLQSDVYTRDAVGNPTSLTTPAGTTNFTYDKLGRLVGETGAAGTGSYSYDAAGNITSVTSGSDVTAYTYAADGALTSVGTQPVTENADGEVTSVGSSTYSWNPLGQLAGETSPGTAASYTYDGNGLLAATTGSDPAAYLWDVVDPGTGRPDTVPSAPVPAPAPIDPGAAGSLDSLVTSAAGTTNEAAAQAALPTLVSDGADTFLTTTTGDVLGQVTSAGSPSWYLHDGLGSVVGTTGSTGAVASTTTYGPFGQVVAPSGGASAAFGFTDQYQEPGGTLFLRARTLDPAIGRFLSADSVQPSSPGTQGYDRYSYAYDDPTLQVDPSGHGDLVEGPWVTKAALVLLVRQAATGALSGALGCILGEGFSSHLSVTTGTLCVVLGGTSGALAGLIPNIEAAGLVPTILGALIAAAVNKIPTG